MSTARSELVSALTFGFREAEAEERVAEYERTYAHELAERIRERARRIEEIGGSATGRFAEDTAVRRRAWGTAADLIDPEVMS